MARVVTLVLVGEDRRHEAPDVRADDLCTLENHTVARHFIIFAVEEIFPSIPLRSEDVPSSQFHLLKGLELEFFMIHHAVMYMVLLFFLGEIFRGSIQRQ